MVNMSDYTPPFSISNKMLGFVSSISEKIGKISNYNDFESKPQLRKNNRISPSILRLPLRLTRFQFQKCVM